VCVVSLAGVASLAAQNSIPVPPVKPGLWETRMSQLDANGQEVPSPEFAALSKMPPEQREKMAEAMRARGVQLPDANGIMKACLSKESLDSGAWQQLAAQSGMRNHVQHPDELRLEMALGLRIDPLGIGRRDGIQRL